MTFDQKKFLEAYRRFYGEPYPTAAEDRRNAHVKGQMMVYLLSQAGVNMGDYGFVWGGKEHT